MAIKDGSINDLIQAFKEQRQGEKESGKEQVSRLSEIAAKIKDQTTTIDLQTQNDNETQKKLRSLQMTTQAGDPLIQQLGEDFKLSQKSLQDAMASGDQEAIELARQQVEAAQDAIQSEEDKREALAKQDEANSTLTKIADGVSDFGGKAAKTAGFLAGIAGLATLFFSPETFAEIVNTAINVVKDIVSVIQDFVTGDFESMRATISKNFGTFAAIIGVGIIAALPKLLRVIRTLKTAFTTFRVFMASEFVANMMANLRSMMKSVGAKFMKVFRGLTTMFTTFGTFMKTSLVTPLISNLKSMMASVGSAMMGMVTKLVDMFKAFGFFIRTTFVPTLIGNLKSMMAAVGGAFMKLFKGLVTAFQVFRVFMMGSFIPSMLASLTAIGAAMVPVLAAMAPILLPILAIAAVFAGLYFGLQAIKDAMGFTSILDVIMLGVAHLKDAFGHVVNAIGSIVNFIFGIVEGIASFIGFDVELPKVPKMSTDNAEKKKAELDIKAEEERIRKAEEDRKQQELNMAGPGTEMIELSTDNALANITPPKETKVITQQNVNQSRNESNRVTVLSSRDTIAQQMARSYAR
jgi:hypothetical protein|tara:strand:+ start:178 stop:1908 length:1731 start_codon:yes stop_codon:yes gene_type:complete